MKLSSIGRHLETAEMKLVDADGRQVETVLAGKLLARTARMRLGCWNGAIQTPEPWVGGWFDAQDLVRVDEEGCFWFMGRTADLILRDGMKVASNMLVEGLTQHPAIAEAVVVGIRNDRFGQLPVAFYRRVPGAEEEPTQEALMDCGLGGRHVDTRVVSPYRRMAVDVRGENQPAEIDRTG